MLNDTKKIWQILDFVSNGQKMLWEEWNHMNYERAVEIYQSPMKIEFGTFTGIFYISIMKVLFY